jgi:hypothetical protein
VVDLCFIILFRNTTWGNWYYLEDLGSDYAVIAVLADFTAREGLNSSFAIEAFNPIYNYKKTN